MNIKRSLLQLFGFTLVVLFLVGCGAPPATSESEAQVATPTAIPSTATATSVPPTATSTPMPPTETPTPMPPTLIPKTPPEKILFIGNSLVGVWNESNIENMAASANPPLAIEADSTLLMGAILEEIWKESDAREQIAEGDYDVVVLQEDLPYTDEDTFHEYARMFDAEINAAGAETVLFMAWSYEVDIFGKMTSLEEIAQAHNEIAAELGVEVIPIGLAFQRVREESPDLKLTSDGEHAGIYGKYLAINVVYATLFGQNPIDLAYLPEEFEEITEEDAAYLQRIALETVLEYQD